MTRRAFSARPSFLLAIALVGFVVSAAARQGSAPGFVEYGGWAHVAQCSIVGRMPTKSITAAEVSKYHECPSCLPMAAAAASLRNSPGPSAQLVVVRASAARQHVGNRITIEDEVAEIAREPQSGFTYVNFGRPFPNHVFRAIIPDSVSSRLSLATLSAQFVRVTGIPMLSSSGIPEILCSDPTQVMAVVSAIPAAAVAVPGPATAAPPSVAPPTTPPVRKCCRVCSTGKPCGDSCIARTTTCRQPPGCAC